MRKKMEKNMRKALAGCLAGCGSKEPAAENAEQPAAAAQEAGGETTADTATDAAADTTANTQEEITFTWMINKVEIKNELEEVAQAYMDSHENITIITEVAGGSVEPYGTRLKAKLGSNDMPALFVTEGPSDYEML